MMKRQKWTEQEDDFMSNYVLSLEQENIKIKWTSVQNYLRINKVQWSRSAKQCRERWVYYLKPLMTDTKQPKDIDIFRLLDLVKTHGKKWSIICKEFSAKNDTSIKNFFYCSLKKGLRNLNFYNLKFRVPKIYKQIKIQVIDKLLYLLDEKKVQNLRLTNSNVFQIAQDLRQYLIFRSQDQIRSKDGISEQILQSYKELNLKVQQFRKLCKFKRSKNTKSNIHEQNFCGFVRKKAKDVSQSQKQQELEKVDISQQSSNEKNTNNFSIINKLNLSTNNKLNEVSFQAEYMQNQLSCFSAQVNKIQSQNIQMQSYTNQSAIIQKFDLFQELVYRDLGNFVGN